ncbi:GGDEF domain-containing protein [Luteimonas deserti]|uniref:diguanylate cyclase n=1 Tax=Luteimonas deserti TaxID=2752306 RepID=A0A7Z0TX79_9GAMM|nr:GGDEF domain-containing protein [Luteimonas deserti]NYZ61535.1 GGDEF domain-containing protein [Luteimonas deserti]
MPKSADPKANAERAPRGPARGRSAAIGSEALVTLFAGVDEPKRLLTAFADGMAGLHDELGDLGRYLQAATRSGDWLSYGRAMRQLIDKYVRHVELDTPAPGSADTERLRDLLRHTLGAALAALLRNDPALSDEAFALASGFRNWAPGQDLDPLGRRLTDLCHRVGVHTQDTEEQITLLISLFDLLLENVSELLENKSWLHGQITQIRALLAGPLDKTTVEEARNGLRQVLYRQAMLKKGIDESRTAMRGMLGTFVERLDGMAAHTGEFQDRLAGHASRIREARSIAEFNGVLDAVLDDTGRIQARAISARDDLIAARRELEESERRISQLEEKLSDAAGLAREDELTGCLNRRGFDEAFEREAARARDDRPLCMALADLDDFRRLNAIHGHLGGDAALRHFADVARLTLRDSDVVGRFGGEEFVILMPATTLPHAIAALARLRTVLAHRPVAYDEARISMTFSAGVALRRPRESFEALLKRADLAMYNAKREGKDRSMAAG